MLTIRWVGRITGVLLIGLVLVFAIGQGVHPFALSGTEIAMASTLMIALAGMLLLWRHELLGGLMVLAGMAAFYAINFAASGRWPGGWVFPLCFVPGISALILWWGESANSRKRLGAGR